MTVILAHVPDQSAALAFQAAVQEAAWRDSGLVVVNVATGDAPVDPRIAPQASLDELVAAAQESGVAATTEQPLDDDVAGAVLDAAERHGATLVVVGVRHRSPVGKLLLGSVSQRVVLDAACPVLCVKADAR